MRSIKLINAVAITSDGLQLEIVERSCARDPLTVRLSQMQLLAQVTTRGMCSRMHVSVTDMECLHMLLIGRSTFGPVAYDSDNAHYQDSIVPAAYPKRLLHRTRFSH
jgi:hypothetical protein